MSKGKVLITGVSGDISKALIPLLLEQDYEIIGIDIKPPSIKEIQFYECDLSNVEAVEKFLLDTASLWIDEVVGIVHLAGIYPNQKMSNYSVDMWEKVQTVNVKSIFFLINNILKIGTESLESIVMVSSTAAKAGSKDPAYAASKAALNGLAKSLSLTLADQRIRVNTILPGIIDTSMSQRQSAERKEYHVSNTLAKKIGTPEEVANVILFLISNKSSYIWGASIDINGGMTL
ncbi:SDR family NAD(P)-dependent oxidoreductase [Bacillus solimangrovi]|uniref:3-oxoacyl-ACP reductase n=1 Tax=Bacillus solimangrovi TaxID=1305675 RepID=A0A1E5LJS5_9BACI|nr:SDR family oxidoreductase [Bacillus solimangrovi]OEH94286.1 hypothetical protein BFG57_08490 [Bacillus solimangrovi]